jgi:hypothetical protein
MGVGPSVKNKNPTMLGIIGLVFIRWVITSCNENGQVRLLVFRNDSNGFPTPLLFRFVVRE